MIEDITNSQEIEIEWNYTPLGYFEDKILLEQNGYTIEINAGYITAKMTADFFDSRPGFRDSLSEELKRYFLGLQIVYRKAFDIQGGVIIRKGPDGRRDVTLVVHSMVHKHTMSNVDLVYTDSYGVVYDTRKTRIHTAHDIGKLSARYASDDQTARKILDSFNTSLRDPQNVLIHLWEIWDALQKNFGDRNRTESVLKLPSNARARLGKLANEVPLNQGRHRGRANSLRDATAEELDEAHIIAEKMVVSYLKYLDQQNIIGDSIT